MEISNEVRLLQLAIMKEALKITSDDSSVGSIYGTSRTSDTFEMVFETLLRGMMEQENSVTAEQNRPQGSTHLGSGYPLSNYQGFAQATALTQAAAFTQSTLSQPVSAFQVSAASQPQSSSVIEAVEKASAKYGIDKDLIMAVIRQESAFNPKAVSSAGAMGLMQLMPGTAAGLGVTNPFDVEQNVDGGTRYLRQMLDRFGGSLEMALMAYNAGPGTVQSRKVRGIEDLDKMPAETQNYVKKVMGYYRNA